MSISPIIYHYFRQPLPYVQTLALQEKIHQIQMTQRKTDSHKDILLLLQHRPVYTAGRRQTEEAVRDERTRLNTMGADFVTATRGGELTYHGPGQIVGYPLMDLSRYSPTLGVQDYVCRMQKTLEFHLREGHGITPIPSQHTGVFLNSNTKIGSIGVQVRHRLTSHGFSLNITREPISWFNQIVACGLEDVNAVSIETAQLKDVRVEDEISGLVSRFGHLYEREIMPMVLEAEGEIGKAIASLEEEAKRAGPWPKMPTL
ncbi:hypothetical protein C0993_000525 [Termitomyces sp. T159_Od127]|nr:hypothetical protein C0993_000525 [Termitomyces sp. T159_Od127]